MSRKLETMFLKNLFDIQDKRKSKKFLVAKDNDGRTFLLYDGMSAFCLFGECFFDLEKAMKLLNQEKPYMKLEMLLDNFDGREVLYDGTTMFANNEVVYFKTTGDNVRTCIMNKDVYKLLQDYNDSFPFDGSLQYDFEKNIFRYTFGDSWFAIILGIGGYKEK